MTKEKLSWIFILIIFLSIRLDAQQRSSMTIYFTTLGNCGICQNRIQNSVKNLPGIDTVYWNIPKRQTTVTYDETVTNPYTIMHAIANVGHDNEWFRAPDSAYNLLVGSCCEYLRTIDYDTVKVGYLGLMGIWIYPLGTHEAEQKDFRVAPTIGNGLFQISASGSLAPGNFELRVYSIKGTKILSDEFTGSIHSVDLRSFPNGQYLIVLSDKNRIISCARVLKAE